MKAVREPAWNILSVFDAIRDLREVVSDIAQSINSNEDIRVVALTGLDGPGDSGGGGGGADHDHVYHEELGAAQAGAVWQFSQAHVSGSERVFLNNLPLRRVASGPGVNEYTINVTTYTITLWASKGTGDFLEVDYAIASAVTHTHVQHEELGAGQAGSQFFLGSTPTVGSERLYLNNLPLRRVASGAGINEYTISGTQVDLWASKGTTDFLEADYLV